MTKKNLALCCLTCVLMLTGYMKAMESKTQNLSSQKPNKKDLKELKTKVKAKKQKIQQLQGELTKSNEKIDDLNKKLQEKDALLEGYKKINEEYKNETLKKNLGKNGVVEDDKDPELLKLIEQESKNGSSQPVSAPVQNTSSEKGMQTENNQLLNDQQQQRLAQLEIENPKLEKQLADLKKQDEEIKIQKEDLTKCNLDLSEKNTKYAKDMIKINNKNSDLLTTNERLQCYKGSSIAEGAALVLCAAVIAGFADDEWGGGFVRKMTNKLSHWLRSCFKKSEPQKQKPGVMSE
jgi:septal ring factor EnvC (AmiA/AmiB activator)